MNKNTNLIEKRLLSRCRTFEKESKIVETLEKRYSATGDQKNFLVLKPTSDSSQLEKKKKLKNLLHEIQHFGSSNNKYNKSKTRNEFKLFIKSNLSLQRVIENKLRRAHNCKLENLKEFKKLLKFEDFIQLNDLWNEYIKSLIQLKKPLDKLQQQDLSGMLSKLSSADLIGSFLTVTASTNSNIVGTNGIVIWESQHNFIIVVPRQDNWKQDISIPKIDGKEPILNWSLREQIGGMRIVPKKNTMFKLLVPSFVEAIEGPIEFNIVGSRFNIKSYDRANKKFKNHNVDDLI